MLAGALVIESLRLGVVIDQPELVVRRLSRVAPTSATPDQPAIWSLLEFQSASADPDLLAKTLAGALDSPGWYANFDSDGHVYVVFPGKVFRYPRNDSASHAAALAYARTVGVPPEQCDWR